MGKEVEVRHGTNAYVAGLIDLYGFPLVGMDDLSFLDTCGTLTDNYGFANRWALRRAKGIPSAARVLVYRVPQELLIDHGPILPGYIHSYSTRIAISLDNIPEYYFLEKGIPRYNADVLIRNGKKIYQVLYEYLDDIDLI